MAQTLSEKLAEFHAFEAIKNHQPVPTCFTPCLEKKVENPTNQNYFKKRERHDNCEQHSAFGKNGGSKNITARKRPMSFKEYQKMQNMRDDPLCTLI